MINVRNALGTGMILASVLIAPVTTPAQAAATAETVSATSTLTSVQKPCRKHRNPARCRARLGGLGGHSPQSGIRGIGGGIGGDGSIGVDDGIGHRDHGRSRD
ncbi:hypothetical protein J2853_001170 [Streptosporangium lutulentum]|uniref:Uncharacterized protein n=1 Tax=Streptosporangium lutulentum TaxID=1461250 RepID=A0ABT9Q7P3_9ACTN|nr:hypothetical protein [Streptosporangium lutulentum]MDP9841959.1 hypothetical protein [Streptosporangium lutulentum]